MTVASSSQPQTQQQDPDAVVRMGGWLFRQRSWLPLPIALSLVLLPGALAPSPLPYLGRVALVASGSCFASGRCDISGSSRGPEASVLDHSSPPVRSHGCATRCISGTSASGSDLPRAPDWSGCFRPSRCCSHSNITRLSRWEERLLEKRLGDTYREYAARVPRWRPLTIAGHSQSSRLTSDVLMARDAL
jgi:protein-S-isoprenylcysteine O-methyltransferase Ste14